MLGAVVGGVASGLAGGLLGGSSKNRANTAAAKQFDNIQVPEIQDMMLELENLVQQGVYTPEQAQAILLEQSAMGDISVDPALREAQMQALQQLQDLGVTGQTAAGQAQLARIRGDQIANERGSREAILQNAAMRGIGGSGLELASQLQAQQSSAGNRNLADLEVAAMEEQNRMNAIQGAGQLGGQMSQQEFNQQAQIAQAQDAIQRFNAQARQESNYFNTNNRNQAAQQNLAERQRIADANAGIRNMQQQYNKELNQQDFGNQLNLAQSKANALANQASNNMAAQQNRNQLIGGFMQAGANVGAQWDQNRQQQTSDKNAKTNIRDISASDFLDELTGYKYSYKDSKHGNGEQVGVMAQDLEKVAPQAVSSDEDGTLRIDFSKLGGPILASLASVNERINKLEDKK